MRYPFLFLLLLLSGCSHYPFSSNLDKGNFTEYFKASKVTIYSKDALKEKDHQIIGAVEGSSCQGRATASEADIIEARTNARINAANMGANGIVIHNCIHFAADNICLSNIICYGSAINVSIE